MYTLPKMKILEYDWGILYYLDKQNNVTYYITLFIVLL